MQLCDRFISTIHFVKKRTVFFANCKQLCKHRSCNESTWSHFEARSFHFDNGEKRVVFRKLLCTCEKASRLEERWKISFRNCVRRHFVDWSLPLILVARFFFPPFYYRALNIKLDIYLRFEREKKTYSELRSFFTKWNYRQLVQLHSSF